MKAYHSNPQLKAEILATLAAHRAADEIVKGQYWQNGKGCAVGCTVKSGDHMAYESQFGIPVMLARLEDRLFEGMPNEQAMLWPERFMAAIEPGADLSLVGWKFQWWLLTDETINPGINHPLVKEAVKLCADALYPLTKGLPFDVSAARSAWSAAWSARSAESAAWSAWSARSAESAAWSAARSARSAESAARSAESAAWSAARSARSAESAARSARSAAWSAAWSAESAAYSRMADKIIDLISECKGDAA